MEEIRREIPVCRCVAPFMLMTAALVVSCADGGGAGGAAKPDSGLAASPLTANRLLVRTAHLVIEVEEPEKARARVQEVTAGKGGFTEQIEARAGGRSQACRLVLRIPAEHLDAVLLEIRALAVKVESENQEVRDVTDQSIDLDARLSSLRATEKELLALLRESRDRESGVQEIMAVHHELTEIRTKIETIEGERKALDGVVSFATIDLEIHADRPSGLPALAWRPVKFAGECLRVLVLLLKFIAYALIFVIVVIVPIGLLILLPVRFLYRLRSRSKRHAAPPLPPVAAS